MDKVKKFLEGYVEWLAIALGVGFLGWMLYSYVLLKPVSVTVGSTPNVSPGEVDHLVWEGAGQKLKAAMDSTALPPPLGPQKDLSVIPETPNAYVQRVEPVPIFPVPVSPDEEFASAPTHDSRSKKIQDLPDAPALVDLAISGGHSNVPSVVAAAPGAPPAPAQVNQVLAADKNWRTIEGTLHTAELAKSFADKGIVPGSAFSDTTILRVVLIRQERNVDGTWPADDQGTEIAPLDINLLPPLPPINANFNDQKDYAEGFAQKSVTQIVQPPFYQVLQGDAWYEPGTKNPNEVQETDDNSFDPLNPGAYAGDPTKLLPSELKAYQDAKAKQAAKDAARSKNQRGGGNFPPPSNDLQIPAPGGGGNSSGRSRGGRSGVAADPQRDQSPGGQPTPAPFFPVPPGFNTGQVPQNGGSGGNGGSGSGGGSGGAAPSAATGPLPAGSFDPSQQGDFKMWAHDATVQAGKTYRYKLRYIISNPVARSNGLVAKPELAKQFYIVSKDSAWTEPVSVESDTNFYAVEQKHGIHFDVFKWKNGIWQMQSVQVNPGDMVGSVDTAGTKTDFTTGWTLVDVREDPSGGENRTLVLVSDNGTVLTKDLATDQHSPGYRRLYLLANTGKPVANGNPSPGILAPPIN